MTWTVKDLFILIIMIFGGILILTGIAGNSGKYFRFNPRLCVILGFILMGVGIYIRR